MELTAWAFLQVAIKLAVTIAAMVLLAFFLFALWPRDLDLSQYRSREWLLGRWFESWFPENPNLMTNGSFEQGWLGWGSGWIESMPNNRDFARQYRFLNLKGAQGTWEPIPEGGRAGSAALRVHYESERLDHRFSTLSQMIAVKPSQRYIVRFWVKVEAIGPISGLSLRAGISDPKDWELGKKDVEPRPHDWKEYHFYFIAKEQAFVDIRFVAEAPLRGLVDDVSVREAH